MKNEKLDGMRGMFGEDVYDYLEMAEEAKTKKTALEYVEKALALEPDNADALMMKADLTVKNKFELLEELDKIIGIAAAPLKKERLFDKCRGDFWGLLETRPYMRAQQKDRIIHRSRDDEARRKRMRGDARALRQRQSRDEIHAHAHLRFIRGRREGAPAV